MINKQKMTPRLILAGLMTLPLLASCGLRGGLQRPDPIFKPAAESVPVEAATEPARESIIIRQRVNEFGGEIPDAAPTEPVISAPITESVNTDDETE